jgi:ADP-heptose:LPS heptosyltransferase
MIGFFVQGGIGDAILAQPVLKKLKETYSDDICLFYFNDLVAQVLEHNFEDASLFVRAKSDKRQWRDQVYKQAEDLGCDFVFSNILIKDHEGFLNQFYAIKPAFMELERQKRQVYLSNLSERIGFEIKNVKDHLFDVMRQYSIEDNCYVDINAFGINVSYDDMILDVPQIYYDKIQHWLDENPKFAIVHDSSMPSFEGKARMLMRSWELDRWNEVSKALVNKGFKVVQLTGDGYPIFEGAVTQKEAVGDKMQFYTILALLSRCDLYVGTDSWPNSAAVYHRQPKYIVMKGPSVRRWDHQYKYADIVRSGSCQGCESYVASLDSCHFQEQKKLCMTSITAEQVLKRVELAGF